MYEKIAAEAAQMDADGARISLMALHFGVDGRTVKEVDCLVPRGACGIVSGARSSR